ncbi:MAG TPA: FAD-binding oxidoreductase [Ignavibacteria bacterium]|nr:FAD-binding oxidoreductase [Ignavibacteria bacterium]HMR40552.1 FAD-binding oxidoreductase [Ignavibacteria bacterium]
MEPTNIKIISIENATHDVRRIRTVKPADVNFTPGQAADISINKEGWKEEVRPFTFTCVPEDDFLEFTIKTYPSHNGVTNELLSLNPEDELIISGVFGAIHYEGEGVFIAGGAGVTPFISILRELHRKNQTGNNMLIFANKTKDDIINENEFSQILGKNFINILSQEKTEKYFSGHIDKDFLKNTVPDINSYFYVCGPPPMMDAVEQQLADLGVKNDKIVKEEF